MGLVGMGDIPICRNRTTPTALRLVSVVSGGQKICCFPFFFPLLLVLARFAEGEDPGKRGRFVRCAGAALPVLSAAKLEIYVLKVR